MSQTGYHGTARHRDRNREVIPRALTRAMLALVLACLALVTAARLTDRPLVATPPAGNVVVERQFLIAGDLSGAATVRAPDGTLLADL